MQQVNRCVYYYVCLWIHIDVCMLDASVRVTELLVGSSRSTRVLRAIPYPMYHILSIHMYSLFGIYLEFLLYTSRQDPRLILLLNSIFFIRFSIVYLDRSVNRRRIHNVFEIIFSESGFSIHVFRAGMRNFLFAIFSSRFSKAENPTRRFFFLTTINQNLGFQLF